jgi:hypothetical protein
MSKNSFVKTFALISVIALLLVSCDSATESTCGTKMTADTTLILKASGPTNFSLVTPDARKDCHAEFELFFGWADPAKRETDQFKPALDWTFQVFPGFFFIPAPQPELWEQEDGYWWHVKIDEGAKNQDDEYVQYQIVGTLGSINDEIMIKAKIKYVPY